MTSCCANRLTQLWVILIGLVALIAGCTPTAQVSVPASQGRAEEPNQASTPASSTSTVVTEEPPAMEPAKLQSGAGTTLALTFKPGQVTTYSLVTEWYRQVVVRGKTKDGQPAEVESGRTGRRVEMTFTQSVRGIGPDGLALIDVRIKGLKVRQEELGDPLVDFDSSSAKDAGKPLAKAVGQGYQIEMKPDGQVTRVVELGGIMTAAEEDTSQGKEVAKLLSEASVRDRHTVSALAAGGYGSHQSGQSWSRIETVGFDPIGSRSFEKVYTFKGLEQIDGRSVAVIGLDGVLSAKGSEDAYATKDKNKVRAMAETFDMSFTYTGQCRLDLTAGEVEQADESLQVEWVGLDPGAKAGDAEGEPNSIRMRSTQATSLQRVAPAVEAQAAIPSPPSVSEGHSKIRCVLRLQEGQAVEYKFMSRRDVQIQWDPNRAAVGSDPNNANDMVESLDLVMVYRPVKVDPNGLVTIEALCKSVKARRTQLSGRADLRPDAVEGLENKTFVLTVDSVGKIHDAKSLDALLKEVGRLPFRDDPKNGRIKDPDMISDVVATQWFLWDAISSMDPNGEAVGRTWSSRLSLPTPMVMREARDVTYRLEGVQQGQADGGRMATISSRTKRSEQPAPVSWPIPYSGKFKASGPFGFLGGYKVLSFEGKGQELFDLDAGVFVGYDQQFRLEMGAMVPMGMKVSPRIIIRQTIKMERL